MATQKRRNPSKTPSQQPSIQQHFYNSEHKKTTHSSSPESKRRKLDSETSTSPGSQNVPVTSMYNFGSTRPSSQDLSNQHGNNPKPRRTSNATTLSMQSAPGSNSLGPKKFVIKNLKSPNASKPNTYISETMAEIENALIAIFDNRRPAKSNEELYKGTENLCKLGSAPDLAKVLDQKCKEHIATRIQPGLAQRADDKDVDVLRAVVEAWKVWYKQTLSIRSILFYLDRTYLLQSALTSILESSIKIFRSHVFGESTISGKAVDGACQLVLADRRQEVPNTVLFKDAVDMFHELGVYTNEFEPRFLASSQQYIAQWADDECINRELPQYILGCNDFINSEMSRCDGFDLDNTTRRELLQLLEHHLIERKEADLTDRDSIADLLDTDDIPSLGALFTLLQRRRLGTKLKAPFAQWIDDTGTSIVFDEKRQNDMVVNLLSLKVKLDKTWRHAFQKDRELSHTVRESFEAFINKSKKTSATWNTDNSKPGEMIAKYVDQLLRSGAKAIPRNLSASAVKPSAPLAKTDAPAEDNNEDMDMGSDDAKDEDAAVDAQLDAVLDLFRFVHGKAVFEAFYKKDLARRLLMGRSASNDAEKSMLNRLQAECGSNFTHNLEQMFRDVELARGEMSGYKDRIAARDSRPPVDLNVNILSAAAWPTYPDVPVVVPAEVGSAIGDFERYYQGKHTGRKLSWKHALAHCQLRARFSKGHKELVVSSFQAVVLLLFNGLAEGETIPYSRILAESGLPEVEVKRTLQSLACAKLRPLTKHPKGRDINDDDVFSVNDGFSHERYRVKINAIQLKETAEENKETHERVAADRQYETQAAIVRIMKSRKTIGHQELVAETIKATKSRGVLQPAEIKRNVDKLVEKEYLERLEGGRFGYLA